MQSKNIQKQITKSSDSLKVYMQSFLKERAFFFEGSGIFGKDIANKLIPFVTSGKMLRGVLVLLAAPRNSKDAYLCASALELCHSMLLVHDDIIDEDLVRRGAPSVYALYSAEHKKTSTRPLHYGISQAICLGDIGFFLAFDALSKLKNESKVEIQKFFMEEMVRVGLGEMDDVHFGLTTLEPSPQEILAMYTAKTARYSISAPVALGMYLSNEPKKLIKKCITIGEYLGTVFQLKDDELGLFGDAKDTGKGVFKDIEQNKKTLLRYLLLENSNTTEKKYLLEIFGNKNLKSRDISYILNLCEKYNIKEVHGEYANDLLAKAEILIKTTPVKYQQIFRFIIEFNNNRIK